MRTHRRVPRFHLAPGAGRELVIVGTLLVLAAVASVIWPGASTFVPAGLVCVLFAFLLYFFRDPERIPPAGEGLLLAPADGRVVAVEKAHEPCFLEGESLKISIFMSLLDVHVNRAPAEGHVALVEHVPGQFLPAFRPEASKLNEHNLVGLHSRYGQILVTQVAGVLARRIVCWVRSGQRLRAGDRLGLVKFGSRVDLYVPPRVEPNVRVGDQVRAGVTVVARWRGREII